MIKNRCAFQIVLDSYASIGIIFNDVDILKQLLICWFNTLWANLDFFVHVLYPLFLRDLLGF